MSKMTKQALLVACKNNTTIIGVLSDLGYKAKNGAVYKQFHAKVLEFGIDTSHFERPGFKKGHQFNRIPLDEALVKDSDYKIQLI